MDTAAIDARGIKPIQADLAKVGALKTSKEVSAYLSSLPREGSGGMVAVIAMPDLKNTKDMIANVAAGGISLPDRDYYFKDDARSKQTREEFVKHVARMLELLGDKPEAATAAAQKVLSFETALAESMMTNVQRRDPYSRYHKMDFAALQALTPDFDWKPVFDGPERLHDGPAERLRSERPEEIQRATERSAGGRLEDLAALARGKRGGG